MTIEQQEEALNIRKELGFPWHSPPHFAGEYMLYHISAACYQHQHIIGYSIERMTEFEKQLLQILSTCTENIIAWCVLTNHYHVLVEALNIKMVIIKLGQFHGRSSYDWNTIECKKGRKCWYRCTDRAMRTERHKWVTLNYIHHNPVHHKYVKQWKDWQFSSATSYLESISDETATERWRKYPLKDYGKGWDDADI